MFRINGFLSQQIPPVAKNRIHFFDQNIHRVSRSVFSPLPDKFSKEAKKQQYCLKSGDSKIYFHRVDRLIRSGTDPITCRK